jgi:hypothetical protein
MFYLSSWKIRYVTICEVNKLLKRVEKRSLDKIFSWTSQYLQWLLFQKKSFCNVLSKSLITSIILTNEANLHTNGEDEQKILSLFAPSYIILKTHLIGVKLGHLFHAPPVSFLCFLKTVMSQSIM